MTIVLEEVKGGLLMGEVTNYNLVNMYTKCEICGTYTGSMGFINHPGGEVEVSGISEIRKYFYDFLCQKCDYEGKTDE